MLFYLEFKFFLELVWTGSVPALKQPHHLCLGICHFSGTHLCALSESIQIACPPVKAMQLLSWSCTLEGIKN